MAAPDILFVATSRLLYVLLVISARILTLSEAPSNSPNLLNKVPYISPAVVWVFANSVYLNLSISVIEPGSLLNLNSKSLSSTEVVCIILAYVVILSTVDENSALASLPFSLSSAVNIALPAVYSISSSVSVGTEPTLDANFLILAKLNQLPKTSFSYCSNTSSD